MGYLVAPSSWRPFFLFFFIFIFIFSFLLYFRPQSGSKKWTDARNLPIWQLALRYMATRSPIHSPRQVVLGTPATVPYYTTTITRQRLIFFDPFDVVVLLANSKSRTGKKSHLEQEARMYLIRRNAGV